MAQKPITTCSLKLIIYLFFSLFVVIGCKTSNFEQKTWEANNHKITYTQTGKGDTTLLFLPGWSIDRFYWNHTLHFFNKKYNCLAIDIPGFGHSVFGGNEATIENLADVLNQFVNHLNLTNTIIVAHCISGNIGLKLALNNKERFIGFVGVDNFKTVGYQSTKEEKKQLLDFTSMLKMDYYSTASKYTAQMLFDKQTPDSVALRVLYDVKNTPVNIGKNALLSSFHQVYKEREELSRLHVPLKLINAKEPPTMQTALNNRVYYGVKIYEISNCGHYPMIEQPEKFNILLQQAIRE